MPLEQIIPSNYVDGFTVSYTRREETIVVDLTFAHFVLPYHYDIIVTYDGTNPDYSHESEKEFCLKISKLVKPCRYSFTGPDPVVMLNQDETVRYVMLCESYISGGFGAVLQFGISKPKVTGLLMPTYQLCEFKA